MVVLDAAMAAERDVIVLLFFAEQPVLLVAPYLG